VAEKAKASTHPGHPLLLLPGQPGSTGRSGAVLDREEIRKMAAGEATALSMEPGAWSRGKFWEGGR